MHVSVWIAFRVISICLVSRRREGVCEVLCKTGFHFLGRRRILVCDSVFVSWSRFLGNSVFVLGVCAFFSSTFDFECDI